jgi:peptidoglycan DL-endopeptidase CwlO
MRARKISFVAALVASAVSAVAVFPGPVGAAVADKQAEVRRLADELDALAEAVARYAEDYAVAIDEQTSLQAELATSRARVAATESQLDELRGNLTALAVQAFVSGGRSNTFAELLTSTGGLTEVVQREHLTVVALDAGADSTEDLDTLVGRLDRERRELERKEQRAAQLASDAEQARASAEKKTVEYQERYRKAQVELGDALAAERARREAAMLAEAERIAAQNAANRPAGGGGSGGGGSGGGGSGTVGGRGGSQNPRPSVDIPTPPPPSSKSGIAVNAAMAQLGVPYRYATSKPGVSFDCSGLTKYAWGRAGVYLPHQSRQQFAATPRVPKDQAQPGDLIFYYSPISHVAIYLGGGRLVHAPATGDVVKISAVNWGKVVGVTRPG